MWLGIIAYKHVEYSGELWWRFTFSGDAPRFLRATVGAIAVTLSCALARLLRPTSPEPALPGIADVEKARAIVERSCLTYAHLALLGDKAFLFSDNGTAFIMYGIEGRSWIALGDPVGPEREIPELIWRYRELCDRHNGWTVFYEVHANNLHFYIDLGLTLLKLGEEARVPLTTFSLEGGARRGLRRVHSRLERAGCSFEVLPREEVPPLLPELKAISDAWLAEKNTREKGFSVGFFDEGYLQRFPAGLVRWEGKIMAFVNILLGADQHQLSLDLMRYLPEAPHGIMEYLFIELMLWGKREGYQWFGLGMAPLAGLESRPLAPLWNHLAGLVFRHGEHFYNFQGLRQFKEQFGPEWGPKYLASSSGLALPRILANIAALTSRGLKGAIAK
jgi:phosphatidylglycerol lysyltransferase